MLSAQVKTDFRRFDATARRFDSGLSVAMRRSASRAGKAGANWARFNHKHKRRTGRLTSKRNLFSFIEIANSRTVKAAIVNTTPYARFVEGPTRPHFIRPKRAKALRFRVNGRVVFARKVLHPGTPAMPFMAPALRPAFVAATRQMRTETTRLAQLWK
jgi:hypothetical protein